MSTTGHYTRYINQFPGWSDNCDTMYQCLWDGDPDKTDGLKFSAKEIGSLTVVHNHGNTKSWCTFDNWCGTSHKYGYNIHAVIIGYTRKKAIQAVLETISLMDIPVIVSDIVFDHINFYKFAYLDYINRIETFDPTRSGWNRTECLNDWLDCDVCHCVQSDQPFTCRYMVETKGGTFEDKHPVCKYFQAFIGSIEVTT